MIRLSRTDTSFEHTGTLLNFTHGYDLVKTCIKNYKYLILLGDFRVGDLRTGMPNWNCCYEHNMPIGWCWMLHTNMALHCGRACRQYLLHLAHDNVDFRLPVQTVNLPYTQTFVSKCLFCWIKLSGVCLLTKELIIHTLFCTAQFSIVELIILSLRSNCIWYTFINRYLNYWLQEIKALLSLRNQQFDTSETFIEKVMPKLFFTWHK